MRFTVRLPEFCEWEGVSVASFYNCQKKLSRTESVKQTVELVTSGRSSRSLRKASFLLVQLLQTGATTTPSDRIEIQLANGVRVFVPMTDSETVEKMIAVASRLAILDDSAMPQAHSITEDATC